MAKKSHAAVACDLREVPVKSRQTIGHCLRKGLHGALPHTPRTALCLFNQDLFQGEADTIPAPKSWAKRSEVCPYCLHIHRKAVS